MELYCLEQPELRSREQEARGSLVPDLVSAGVPEWSEELGWASLEQLAQRLAGSVALGQLEQLVQVEQLVQQALLAWVR